MEASAVDAVAVPPVSFIPVRVIGHPEQAVPPATRIDSTRTPGTEVSPTPGASVEVFERVTGSMPNEGVYPGWSGSLAAPQALLQLHR
jgi:hypothetical protein